MVPSFNQSAKARPAVGNVLLLRRAFRRRQAYGGQVGADAGAYLVAHPGLAFYAFTGSRAVGCGIWEADGRTPPGQVNLKEVVCEMGGMNALIIDNDADLDEAIPAALASAFGYAGQKCSALARLIVLDGVYDRFVPRFLAAGASVPVGDPAEPGTVVNPVIDAAARDSILGIIEQGRREARLAWQAGLPPALVASGAITCRRRCSPTCGPGT